jgi:hypothetical protein
MCRWLFSLPGRGKRGAPGFTPFASPRGSAPARPAARFQHAVPQGDPAHRREPDRAHHLHLRSAEIALSPLVHCGVSCGYGEIGFGNLMLCLNFSRNVGGRPSASQSRCAGGLRAAASSVVFGTPPSRLQPGWRRRSARRRLCSLATPRTDKSHQSAPIACRSEARERRISTARELSGFQSSARPAPTDLCLLHVSGPAADITRLPRSWHLSDVRSVSVWSPGSSR